MSFKSLYPHNEAERGEDTRESYKAILSTRGPNNGSVQPTHPGRVKKYCIRGGIRGGGPDNETNVHSLVIRDVTERWDAQASERAAIESAREAEVKADEAEAFAIESINASAGHNLLKNTRFLWDAGNWETTSPDVRYLSDGSFNVEGDRTYQVTIRKRRHSS